MATIDKIIPLEIFDWDSGPRTLSAEASDLIGYEVGEEISIQSSVTGKIYVFFESTLKCNKEGEYLYWSYLPDDDFCPVKKVLIFND